MKEKATSIIVLLILTISVFAQSNSVLEDQFKNPPPSAKALTWWHWINGNVSREGISADLEAMKKIGIQGAQLFDVTLGHPKGPVSYLSPEWLLNNTDRPTERVTFASYKHWDKDSELLPSGLLGPVKIVVSKVKELK